MGAAVRRAHIRQADIPVSGVESITDIGGGQVRVVYYINRSLESGALVREILPYAHIMPAASICDAIGKSMMAISRKIIARPDGSLTVAH